jgi:hypothetical protein
MFMKTNSTLVLVIRIIAFVLLCLYSLLVFGQPKNTSVRKAVPLNKFTGVVVNDNSIKLQWTLATGNTASSVTIEKGNNDASFQPQAEYWVNMEGNFQTEFKWSDAKIAKGSAYYRLKITDGKGNVTYSNVLQLNNKKKANLSFSEYPSQNASTQTAKRLS